MGILAGEASATSDIGLMVRLCQIRSRESWVRCGRFNFGKDCLIANGLQLFISFGLHCCGSGSFRLLSLPGCALSGLTKDLDAAELDYGVSSGLHDLDYVRHGSISRASHGVPFLAFLPLKRGATLATNHHSDLIDKMITASFVAVKDLNLGYLNRRLERQLNVLVDATIGIPAGVAAPNVTKLVVWLKHSVRRGMGR